MDLGYDIEQAKQWIGYRNKFPAREGAQVLSCTRMTRPNKGDQQQWHHYRQLRDNREVGQEWWLPPFLLPVCPKKGAVKMDKPEHALQQCPAHPAPGGQMAMEHFTNIHRIKKLADQHPMVLMVVDHKVAEKAKTKQVLNEEGRVKKKGGHQSLMDLRLTLSFGVEFIVGCSVNATKSLSLIHI